MSIFDKVYNTLVTEGNERTAAQMANFFNTTPATIRARISDLRSNGVAVYANT
jgi:predicted ArsR family transcriptional regulator